MPVWQSWGAEQGYARGGRDVSAGSLRPSPFGGSAATLAAVNRLLCPLALVALSFACNAADDPPGGRDAGDDPASGQTLGELSAGEVRDLCDSIEAGLGKTLTLEARCTFNAAITTDSAAGCVAALEECMKGGGGDPNPTCTLISRQHDEGCAELPVDEVLPCLDQVVDERLTVTCDDAPYVLNDPECIGRLSKLCPFGS